MMALNCGVNFYASMVNFLFNTIKERVREISVYNAFCESMPILSIFLCLTTGNISFLLRRRMTLLFI